MAYTAVVTSGFFQAVIDALRRLETGKGKLALAVMTPYDFGGGERWTISLSAPWLDELSLRAAIREMREFFRRELGTYASKYEGVAILRTNEALVREFTETFDVPAVGTAYRVLGFGSDTFDQNDSVLFVSNEAVRSSRPRERISA